jgi:hypothetical protein
MATNKTRLFLYDNTGASPYSLNLVLEFDIYEDAIAYCDTLSSKLTATADYGFELYLFSNDNESYRYRIVGDEVQKSSTEFPVVVT